MIDIHSCLNIFYLGRLTLSTKIFLWVFFSHDNGSFCVSGYFSYKSGLYEAKRNPRIFTSMLFLRSLGILLLSTFQNLPLFFKSCSGI